MNFPSLAEIAETLPHLTDAELKQIEPLIGAELVSLFGVDDHGVLNLSSLTDDQLGALEQFVIALGHRKGVTS
jgi:hypothetical protein